MMVENNRLNLDELEKSKEEGRVENGKPRMNITVKGSIIAEDETSRKKKENAEKEGIVEELLKRIKMESNEWKINHRNFKIRRSGDDMSGKNWIIELQNSLNSDIRKGMEKIDITVEAMMLNTDDVSYISRIREEDYMKHLMEMEKMGESQKNGTIKLMEEVSDMIDKINGKKKDTINYIEETEEEIMKKQTIINKGNRQEYNKYILEKFQEKDIGNREKQGENIDYYSVKRYIDNIHNNYMTYKEKKIEENRKEIETIEIEKQSMGNVETERNRQKLKEIERKDKELSSYISSEYEKIEKIVGDSEYNQSIMRMETNVLRIDIEKYAYEGKEEKEKKKMTNLSIRALHKIWKEYKTMYDNKEIGEIFMGNREMKDKEFIFLNNEINRRMADNRLGGNTIDKMKTMIKNQFIMDWYNSLIEIKEFIEEKFEEIENKYECGKNIKNNCSKINIKGINMIEKKITEINNQRKKEELTNTQYVVIGNNIRDITIRYIYYLMNIEEKNILLDIIRKSYSMIREIVMDINEIEEWSDMVKIIIQEEKRKKSVMETEKKEREQREIGIMFEETVKDIIEMYGKKEEKERFKTKLKEIYEEGGQERLRKVIEDNFYRDREGRIRLRMRGGSDGKPLNAEEIKKLFEESFTSHREKEKMEQEYKNEEERNYKKQQKETQKIWIEEEIKETLSEINVIREYQELGIWYMFKSSTIKTNGYTNNLSINKMIETHYINAEAKIKKLYANVIEYQTVLYTDLIYKEDRVFDNQKYSGIYSMYYQTSKEIWNQAKKIGIEDEEYNKEKHLNRAEEIKIYRENIDTKKELNNILGTLIRDRVVNIIATGNTREMMKRIIGVIDVLLTCTTKIIYRKVSPMYIEYKRRMQNILDRNVKKILLNREEADFWTIVAYEKKILKLEEGVIEEEDIEETNTWPEIGITYKNPVRTMYSLSMLKEKPKNITLEKLKQKEDYILALTQDRMAYILPILDAEKEEGLDNKNTTDRKRGTNKTGSNYNNNNRGNTTYSSSYNNRGTSYNNNYRNKDYDKNEYSRGRSNSTYNNGNRGRGMWNKSNFGNRNEYRNRSTSNYSYKSNNSGMSFRGKGYRFRGNKNRGNNNNVFRRGRGGRRRTRRFRGR